MRKIKKFRIPVYTHEILRRAKKRGIDLSALGLAAPESAREYIASLAAAAETAAVFDFLGPEDALAGCPGAPFEGRPLTLGAVTLGASFAEKLGAIREPELLRLAETAAEVLGDGSLKVIAELIAQEPGMEGFEPGEAASLFPGSGERASRGESTAPQTADAGGAPPSSPWPVPSALASLQADKIGLGFENGALTPKYSLLFAVPWLSRRKKKAASAPRK